MVDDLREVSDDEDGNKRSPHVNHDETEETNELVVEPNISYLMSKDSDTELDDQMDVDTTDADITNEGEIDPRYESLVKKYQELPPLMEGTFFF